MSLIAGLLSCGLAGAVGWALGWLQGLIKGMRLERPEITSIEDALDKLTNNPIIKARVKSNFSIIPSRREQAEEESEKAKYQKPEEWLKDHKPRLGR